MMFCGKYSKGSLAMSVGRLLSAVVAAVMLLAACSEKGLDTENVPRKFKNRTDAPRSRKVLLLYSAGLVDISNFLKEDIQDLENGYVPRKWNRLMSCWYFPDSRSTILAPRGLLHIFTV